MGRSRADPKGTKEGTDLEKRTLVIIFSIVSVMVLLAAGTITLIVVNLVDFEVNIGLINIAIDGDECNVSAELRFGKERDIEPVSLKLVLDSGEVPVGNMDKMIYAVLNEEQFTEIVDKEYARIEGEVKYDTMLGKRAEREIDTRIDLSFLGEILGSVKITNSKLSTRFPFTSIVDFNMTAEITREVNIYANNTKAMIDNGVESREIDLVHLELTSDGVGYGRVEMPTPTLVSMGLWGRNITLSAWGLDANFVFPFTSQ